MPEPDGEPLRGALTEAVAGLVGARLLTIVEVAADGIVTFQVHRDECGTPRGHGWPLPWSDIAPDQDWDVSGTTAARQTVLAAVGALESSDLVFACTASASPRADQAFKWLCGEHPEAPAYRSNVRVSGLLGAVLSTEPLTRPYDLVALKRDTESGRLEFTSLPLFAIGTRPGSQARASLRCEPSDDHGTVFAVVAWVGREPRPVSIQTAKPAPGRYDLTVELLRPGRVRLDGVPGLAKETRPWAELVASVPAELPAAAGPAHLICAVEVCGAPDVVADRLDRVRQIISTLSAEPRDQLEVSLVAYGAHVYGPGAPEVPVEVADWQVTPERALGTLNRVEERGPITQGYPYHPQAAQLEDMLAEVAGRLGRAVPPRTVLLTVGDRPPHPPRTDDSGLLPCPQRRNWADSAHLLETAGLTLGAIRGQASAGGHPVWSRLGATATGALGALDVRGLGAALGLTPFDPVLIPFPLTD